MLDGSEWRVVEVAVVVPGGLLRLVSLGRLDLHLVRLGVLVVWAKVIKLFFSVGKRRLLFS